MDCIILAGGYGMRLHEDLKKSGNNDLLEIPKGLLPIGNTCILNFLLSWLPEYSNVILVTNNLYYSKFCDYVKSRKNVKVINNKSNNPNEFGSVDNMILGLNYVSGEDFIVMASDTFFKVSFSEIYHYFCKKNANIHLAYIDKTDEIHKKGVMGIDEDGRIVEFEEKPKNPKSNIAGAPVYFIKKETLPYIREYILKYPHKLDKLGDMTSYLIKKSSWFAFIDNGNIYDIGSLRVYNYLCDLGGLY